MNKRIKSVQKALADWGVDTFIVKDPVDLFYLTGQTLSLGTIVITKQKATLIVDGRYFEKCQHEVAMPVVLLSPDALPAALAKTKRLGFAQETVSYGDYLQLAACVRGSLIPLQYPMQKIRAIKEPAEVALMKKAIDLCFEGFDFVKDQLKTGASEQSIAKELEIFWLKKGADKLSFDSIIAFGKNASMPHYRPGSTKLKPNQIVLVDIGVVVNGYASDMTRCFFYAKPDPRLEEIYDIVLEAQTKSAKALKPNLSCADAYMVSKKVIEKAGFSDKYLHGLGHGIGLETHEYPTLRATAKETLLQPGMCVTVEPGIYLPNIGGVRLEDMCLITKDGHKNLTSLYPKTKTIIPPK